MNINKINGTEMASQINASHAVDKKVLKETFKVKMQNIAQEDIRAQLHSIYEKIETSAAKLTDKLRLEDLVEYKNCVREFMNLALNNSHVFFRENSLDRRGRHRVYSIVKRVDLELDELTKEFLRLEENRLSILRRIEEIRGILLDVLT